jgi:hypothetical protein
VLNLVGNILVGSMSMDEYAETARELAPEIHERNGSTSSS